MLVVSNFSAYGRGIERGCLLQKETFIKQYAAGLNPQQLAAVQAVQENYTDQPHVEAQVAMMIANQAADNDNQVSVEQVRRQLEEDYPLAAVPFDDYVEKSDVLDYAQQPVTVTPARIRRMESRSIHTANGIEVKIPTELLNEESEVEFLHDADGSVSLLIKNVIL